MSSKAQFLHMVDKWGFLPYPEQIGVDWPDPMLILDTEVERLQFLVEVLRIRPSSTFKELKPLCQTRRRFMRAQTIAKQIVDRRCE